MGSIRRMRGGDSRHLLNQHLIGRGPQCALRLLADHVSSQHALVRWHGAGWEVVDRASLNGTWLNGERLTPGRPYPITKGAAMIFGHPDECWLLTDTSAPEVMALALDDGSVATGATGIIGLPPGSNPSVTLFRDVDGSWKMELADASVRPMSDGETITIDARTYCVCLPDAATATAGIDDDAGTEEATLHFLVSSDEDFVELRAQHGARTILLGSRAHNYLLLTLARARLADTEAGLEPQSCGWLDKDELAKGLRMNPEHVDGEVFRIRRHFARQGLKEAATIVERRARTKQMRLGIGKLRIDRG